jgi:hypothetical protein
MADLMSRMCALKELQCPPLDDMILKQAAAVLYIKDYIRIN